MSVPFVEVICTCPVCKTKTVLKDLDLCVDASECDLCGYHTRVTLDFSCPSCKKWHTFELKDHY